MMHDPTLISRLCDALIRGKRRWFCLAGLTLALLVCLLLPGLRGLLLALLGLVGGTLLLYLTHRHHAFGAEYQRKPRPCDARCETILIDAALIGQGTRLRAAAQPIDVADGLSLRLGSGALLLGTAMTLTADELPQADRSAILSAVQALNIRPGRLRGHSPVLQKEQADNVSIVTVRDGMSSRRYYVGAPEDLLPHCPAIWEEHTRPMNAHDPARIQDTAKYIERGSCRVLAYATALETEEPIFLGMVGLGENLHMAALKDVSDLRAMGLTLMLDGEDRPDGDLDTLRTLLDLPDHHARADIHLTSRTLVGNIPLGVTRHVGDSLSEPIQQLRSRFATIENTLRHFVATLGFCLVIALLSGTSLLPLASALLLTYGALFIGVDFAAPRLRWPIMLFAAVLAVIARLFLGVMAPEMARPAGCLLPLAVSLCGMIRLCGTGFSLCGKLSWPHFALIGCGLLAVILIVLCLVNGVSSLMPLCFALLLSGAASGLLLLGDKLFS